MRTPDQMGKAGQAWRLVASNPIACLEGWLVQRPGAHPLWEWWVASVVHLREEPGLPPAAKSYPKAQYEFQIRTLDPEFRADPDLWDLGYRFLEPADVIEQFHGVTDDQARFVCTESVRRIVDGGISPDSDYRSSWSIEIQDRVQRFSFERAQMN